MRKLITITGIPVLLCFVLLISCKKSNNEPTVQPIGDEVLAKIKNLGFSTENVQAHEGGYLVEGDIVLTNEILNGTLDPKTLRIAEVEQYRTTALVTGLPRTISIRVNASLPARYAQAVDGAVARYNALNLQLRFARVTSGGNIVINPAPSGSGYLASAGFPSGGNPYSQVLVNRSYLDTWNINTVISIIAHEVGHCIGFRHTDYMGRQYSCGGSPVNEGSAGVGAIHIPGTPTGPDPNSWMLACINNGVNRPFNANDVIALNYLY
ncbi:protease [Pseudoflavitalea sp. G-6-1-2]|uniref:M57 family metalloprotease n=1 Tax=Pseudoflavitalea sp. G-6-1-2 TaxID=2728841 RepID=UPI00146A54AB|nr:M57 family metalloprotease [Pseudoflavitalea sp. G-6-1-2]NML23207.1 protease [Pseudoflavitalea sp. G-6-1-2]